ncbi:YidB family protein [Geobacter sp. SVR]|uniref:YidB family protein n=1 Tax=Geobacter sp. SVR TaxID=2495594 RepID=UPI00143EF77D|nr:YidB family protein [Geobacter sp. SVR]BCS52547.1 hypothetical protein GSVR_08550 [Geobacter sp. SVR]GCF84015.1 hypothetical protein GSbR_06150 [Geobacter sp. SVR]
MGILDEITKKLGGHRQGEEGTNTQLLSGVMEMFSGSSGGLGGLLRMFQERGLGEIVSSWIGTGRNLPISPDQIREGFGSEKIQTLATRLGVPQEEITSRLSQHLPGFVDKLTPNGEIPEGGGLQKAVELLKSRFF